MKRFLIVITLLSLIVCNKASAQEQDVLTLDGKIYKNNFLKKAFFDLVFTNQILNADEDGINFITDVRNIAKEESLKTNYPWLYPHIYPEKGLPKLLAVNKWVKPVRITWGMPNDMRPLKNETYGQYTIKDIMHKSLFDEYKQTIAFKKLETELQDLSELLSGLTNLPISYMPEESDNDLAEIRVNLLSEYKGRPKTAHRSGESMDMPNSYGASFTFFRNVRGERNTKTGLIFSNDRPNNFDGYILSNHKNEIQMAVCYMGKDDENLISLLRECIVRSLGLIGKLDSKYNYLPVKKSLFLNGKNADDAKSKTQNDISEFDKYMIRTLYNPVIKPGMDYYKVDKIF